MQFWSEFLLLTQPPSRFFQLNVLFRPGKSEDGNSWETNSFLTCMCQSSEVQRFLQFHEMTWLVDFLFSLDIDVEIYYLKVCSSYRDIEVFYCSSVFLNQFFTDKLSHMYHLLYYWLIFLAFCWSLSLHVDISSSFILQSAFLLRDSASQLCCFR